MNFKLNLNHNIINFTSKLYKNNTIFLFNSFKYDNYKSNPEWNDIKCSKVNLKDKVNIKSKCLSMQTNKIDTESLGYYKVYVKDYKNLYDYIDGIQKKEISKESHKSLFNYLLRTRNLLKNMFNKKINLINHNLDVKTLHFKFI